MTVQIRREYPIGMIIFLLILTLVLGLVGSGC